MTSAIVVRPLCAADITVLVGVLARAYQSQQNFSWRLNGYLQMRDVATFVAELDGEPVGMVVGNDYGSVGYIAQMAVEPNLRRRGIGTALMHELVAWAERRGFAALELDATPSGAPLYERFGFSAEGETHVYASGAAGGDPHRARRFAGADSDALLALDRRAFGADRGDVLRLLLDSPRVSVFVSESKGTLDGYAIAQPVTELIGPLVAAGPVPAAALFDAAREHLPVRHRVNIRSATREATRLVVARGYVFVRSLVHMIRGRLPRASREMLYARINLGQG
jgi:ribosomal protein S18 acetylase RimI-like enzyme